MRVAKGLFWESFFPEVISYSLQEASRLWNTKIYNNWKRIFTPNSNAQKTKVPLGLLEAMRMDSFLVEFTVHHRFKSSAGRLDL